MLNNAHTRFHADDSQNRKIGSLVTVLEPGMALVSYLEDGTEVVAPSTGVAGEVFAGVAWMEDYAPTTHVRIVTGVADADGLELGNDVLGGLAGISVRINGVRGTVDDAAPGAAGTVFLDGRVVRFHPGDIGATVEVLYRHTLSVLEAQHLYGDGPYGQSPVMLTRTVGVITRGWVFTNMFDPAANWAPDGAIADLALGPNGRFVRAGGGTVISLPVGPARVIHVPSEDNPYLGIYYSV